MNKTIEFANILLTEKKNPAIGRILSNSYYDLPLSVYFGRRSMTDDKMINIIEKLFPNLDIRIAKSNDDEDYVYIALIHKMIVSKKHFIHFNPIEKIYMEGKGWNKQYLDPKDAFDIDYGMNKLMMGPHLISYRTIPIEIKMQFGCLFNNKEEEKEYIRAVLDEIQEELEDKETVEVESKQFDECLI